MAVKEFRSYLSAIAYVAGEHADQYFTVDDATGAEIDFTLPHQDGEPAPALGPAIASTVAAYEMGDERVAASIVQSEIHMGYILSHYTDGGDIVRFVAIKEH